MLDQKKVALFGHHGCRSKFFARLEAHDSFKYRGKCPNPKCNRRVSLMPEEKYTSMDKARREYIRLSHYPRMKISWQT